MKNGNEAMESRLRRGISNLTPNRAEEIFHQPVEPADGSEWYLDGVNAKRRGKTVLRSMLAVAACFVLMVSGLLYREGSVTTDVYLDVNPSVALRVNHSEKVVRVEALNPDAEEIVLAVGTDAKNRPLQEAVDLVLDQLAAQGYLQSGSDSVLVSVRARRGDASDLCTRLTKVVHDRVKALVGSASVFAQQLSKEDSDAPDTMPGRDALVRKLAARLGVPESELSRTTVEQMVQLLRDRDVDPEDLLDDVLDDDWDEDELDDDQDDDFDDDREDDDDEDEVRHSGGAAAPATSNSLPGSGSGQSSVIRDDDEEDFDEDDDDEEDDDDDDDD